MEGLNIQTVRDRDAPRAPGWAHECQDARPATKKVKTPGEQSFSAYNGVSKW